MSRANDVPSLVRQLESSSASAQEQALYALVRLCFADGDNATKLQECGGIPLLARLLNSNHCSIQEAAAFMMGGVGSDDPAAQAAIIAAGGISRLVRLLSSTSQPVQAVAAAALGVLSDDNEDCMAAIVAAGGIPPLVRLLSCSNRCMQALAATLLCFLSNDSLGARDAANQAAIAAAGGIPPLVRLLGSNRSGEDSMPLGSLARQVPELVEDMPGASSPDVQEAAAKTLIALASCSRARRAAMAAGAIPLLVQLLGSSDFEEVQRAVARALKALADGGASIQEAIVAAGGIPALERLRSSSQEQEVREEAEGALRLLQALRSRQPGSQPAAPSASPQRGPQAQVQAQASPRTPQPSPRPDPHSSRPSPTPPAPQPSATTSSEDRTRANLPSDPLLEMLSRMRLDGNPAAGSGGSAGSNLRPWEISTRELEVERLLGAGSFGRVYYARWHHTPQSSTPVALKVLMGVGAGASHALSLSSPELQDLHREADMMSRLRHPQCVRLMGVCVHPAAIAMEYCERGCLTDVFKAAASTPDAAAELSWTRRLSMAADAARGMLCLHTHQPCIIHRDLKSANLLVDAGWRVKVSDFNLSKLMVEGSRRSSNRLDMNPRWLAPEVLKGEPATAASDVYSFGVILWELLTWRFPWEDVAMTWQIASKVVDGGRLEVPPSSELPGADTSQFGGLDAYVDLMQECWAQDPEARPAFDEVLMRLESLGDTISLAPAPAPGLSQPASPGSSRSLRECRICLTEVLPTALRVLVPCGHRAACSECTEAIMGSSRKCPMCRTEIETSVSGSFRVYSS